MNDRSSASRARSFLWQRNVDSLAAPATVSAATGDATGAIYGAACFRADDRRISGPASGMRARVAAALRAWWYGRGFTRSSHRLVILFLAANPRRSTRLALDAECAAIEHELRMSLGRDDFDFRSKWTVTIDDMMRHLNECQPTIVHLAGHGGASIQLQDEGQSVSGRALAHMIASAAPSTRVVVLNACFSDALAESLRNLVDCVVGMTGEIGDDAARSFAVGFYRALGNRRSIGNAVAQAVATLAAKQLPDEHVPVCRTRDGVNVDRLFLPDAA